MNKKILIAFLLVVCVVLGVLNYKSINDEIQYNKKVEEVALQVQGRLDTLRKMELAYRDMKGEFAGSFDKLFDFMQNGRYFKIKEVGDNDGEVANVSRDTTFMNPMEEILGSRNIDIQKYKMVPPDDTATFVIYAGSIDQNGIMVPVFEIKDPHPFDKSNKPLKVGDRRNAITNGNWK